MESNLEIAVHAEHIAEDMFQHVCAYVGANLHRLGGKDQDLLQRIVTPNSHILVFSQFTSFLGLAKKVLEDIGIPYLYLDGTTLLEQRAELVQRFQNGES